MRIGKKIFPYPILNHIWQLSNYVMRDFDVLYDFEDKNDRVIFKDLRFATNSDLLKSLYDEKKIDVVCIVECSDTVFRKTYKISDMGQDLILYKADLSEKTAITFFAYANQDVVINSDEFEEDYQGIDFHIEKYDILAANDEMFITIKHQEKENDLAHSIFSVVNDHGKHDGQYSVDYSLNRITIYLSDDDYKNYKIVYGINEYKEIFFNMLLIPSLIEALTACKLAANDGQSIEEIGDNHHWFRSVVSSYKKLHNEELTVDILKTIKSIEMSQELLGKPLKIAFEKMLTPGQILEGDE